MMGVVMLDEANAGMRFQSLVLSRISTVYTPRSDGSVDRIGIEDRPVMMANF